MRCVRVVVVLFLLGLAASSGLADPIRLALVSDPHVNRNTDGDQPMYRPRFEKVIAAVNAADVALVLIAGDLTQSGGPAQFDDFAQLIKGFQRPVLLVPGNHDVGDKHIDGKPSGPDLARLALYERRFGPSFYARDAAGVHVIGIDSPLFGSGLPEEQAMWTMLEHELARPATRPTVVLSHYPLFVKTPTEPGGEYWNVEPVPRARLLALLKQAEIRTVLTGHLHRPIVNRLDGTIFISTLPVSFGLPKGKQPEGWTLVTLREGAEATYETRVIND
jgi:3',5'-cyclic AMP phosphodiesterase CpdA